MHPSLPSPLAIIDLETTGMTATGDRITEIGIVTVVDGKVSDEWSTLVDPECSIPPEIQALTGITNAMVRAAPTFRQIAAEVQRRLAGHLFVAHNARFDYGFIKNEFRRLDMPFTAEVLCTVRLSRKLFPGHARHSLDALRERHGLGNEGRHRALGDARAAWQFIEIAVREHPAEEVRAAIKALLKMPSLPPQLAPGVLDNLPEGPGVYIFYGINDLPIYIGKGVELRKRIRSHFSSDYRSANDQRLSVEIMRIDYEETAGELGALLREVELIKTMMPLRNQRLRRNREVSFIRLDELNALPEFLGADEIDFADPGSLYGPFPSKARARDRLLECAAGHGLCWNVVAARKGAGPCFAHQIHRCQGYCCGKESLLQHNLRLLAALAAHRFAPWPHAGPVAIREVHAEHGWERMQVFDQWCFRGTAASADELEALLSMRGALQFDTHIFKIIFNHFRKGRAALPLLPPPAAVASVAPA